jgi:hypothetical protein
MSDDAYRLALECAMRDLEGALSDRDRLDAEREEAETRVTNLRHAIFGLATLAGEDSETFTAQHPDLFPELIDPDVGLTDAVREVLKTVKVFITPVKVRDRLTEMHYDLSKYKNVLASLHTVLKRLADNDEVFVDTRGGKTMYRWKVPALRKSK